MAVIGIDIGGTKISGAVFSGDGKILVQKIRTISGMKGREVGFVISALLESLAGNVAEAIKSAGICVPGIAYSKTGKVWAPNIQGWENYPLKDELTDLLSKRDIGISIESDRTCYILGETWKGAARDCTNAIYISVGTGIGAGIMCDGRIIHGDEDIAGATGWMALQSPFQPEYKDCGCFEYYASGRGIVENARRLLKEARGYTGFPGVRNPNEITTLDVFDAFTKNDKIAVRVIDKAVEMWGMAAANFVSIFNPEKIIFGGGVFGPAAGLLGRIKLEAAKWAQPVSMKKVSFERSALKGNAGIYGAAFMALRSESKKKAWHL